MAKIKAYEFKPLAVQAYESWNAKTKTFTPLKAGRDNSCYEAFDDITLAVEAGVIADESWVLQLFERRAAFEEFIAELRDYDDCYRLHDRWHAAFMQLAGAIDEEGFVSSAEVADTLEQVAVDSGQFRALMMRPPKTSQKAPPTLKRKAAAKA
jgi:hypothetical protein